MAQSSEIKSQIDALLGQLNPALDALPGADQYYKDELNKRFNYNLGPLQNAAQLESKMYAMPGNLMGQYNEEFGGKSGISANQRINSILGQLGNQAGVVDVARGLADQSGARINDLASSLANQYRTSIEAQQAKLSPLMSMWDRMYSEEQANSRAARSGSAGYGGMGWDELIAMLTGNQGSGPSPEQIAELKKKNVDWNAGANKARDASMANQRIAGYAPDAPPVANSGSGLLDKYINNFRGVR